MQNEYTVGGTHNFSQELSNLPYLEEDEDSVSYNVEPQFTNIPVKETINYIRDIVASRVKVKAFKCYGCLKKCPQNRNFSNFQLKLVTN